MAQSVPVTPGHDDGGLSRRRMVRMAAVMVGPAREQAHLTLRQTGDWWRTVSQIFESDLEERDEIRPAFRTEHGTSLLESNEPRPLPNWRHLG